MAESPQVDQYILKSRDSAQMILEHLRHLVHLACPDIEETIKWNFPNFVYKGKILCHMAAFKKHCTFGLWNIEQIEDNHHLLEKMGKTAMGHIGKIETLEQLPDGAIIISILKSAMHQIDTGVNLPAKNTSTKPLEIPEILSEALSRVPDASRHFNAFSTSQKREYANWIIEAKTEATRNKRLQTTIEWVSEGKTRQWKYQK